GNIVMRIAMLGNTRSQQDRLSRNLRIAHQFVDPDSGPQEVDAVIALRFDGADAARLRCRLLHTPGHGTDGIIFAALADECWVCNVFEHEGPIAEFVMLAILEHAIGASTMAAGFTAEGWTELYHNRRPHHEVAGGTVGLVGFGHIGRAI